MNPRTVALSVSISALHYHRAPTAPFVFLSVDVNSPFNIPRHEAQEYPKWTRRESNPRTQLFSCEVYSGANPLLARVGLFSLDLLVVTTVAVRWVGREKLRSLPLGDWLVAAELGQRRVERVVRLQKLSGRQLNDSDFLRHDVFSSGGL